MARRCRDECRVDAALGRYGTMAAARPTVAQPASHGPGRPNPQHEDPHGHRARRPTDPDAPPRPPAGDVPARAAGRCPAAPTRTSGRGARTRSTSIAARAAWSGTSTATSTSTCGWATARSSSGHGDERVDDYVNERMRRGVSFSLTSEDEVRAMELVKELTGWVDKARMTVSGTEATMHAMRVARAYTGRDKIVKFEGQYHGVHDYALISVAPGRHVRARRRGRPGRAGLGPRHPGCGRRHDHPGALQQHRARCAACSSARATRSPRSSSSRSSATPRGSCPSRASTRRCGR